MRLRVKSRAGQRTITVDDKINLSDFIQLLNTFDDLKDDVVSTINKVSTGFPSRQLDLSSGTLAEKGVRSGDLLQLEYGKLNGTTNSEIPSVFIPQLNQYLILRNVADDNLCLFNAINYAINGSQSSMKLQELRDVVSKHIAANKDKFTEPVLGRTPEAYCEWITKPNSWGGAIELGILAEWLDVRIVCLDIELGRFMNFQNEVKEPSRFVALVYSGIHYDLLVLNNRLTAESSDKLVDSTCWAISEQELILDSASQLCALLQLKNFATNTTTFRVRCLDCYEVLVGEMGATRHANSTGHFRFGEVK